MDGLTLNYAPLAWVGYRLAGLVEAFRAAVISILLANTNRLSHFVGRQLQVQRYDRQTPQCRAGQ